MKAKFVNESLNEKYGDELENAPEVTDYDLVDDDDLFVQDEFETSINNELEVPEYARQTITFRTKGDDELIEAIPMAKLMDGSYLMKIGDKYRKFNINDIIEE